MQIHSLLTAGAVLTALLTTASNGFGRMRGDAPRIVSSYCSGCHGIGGNPELPFIPRIAGIDSAYAERKLIAFKKPAAPPVDELFERIRKGAGLKDTGRPSRQERINMRGVAHTVKPEVLQQAVQWYSRQPSVQGRSADQALIEQGKELFMNGSRDQKVLACMSCHGPDAQGKGLAPRLAGQNAGYIESQLALFRRDNRLDAPEMTMVARELSPGQVRAAAAYLQSK